MAGHSKFKNIQFRKGKQDKVRSKLFSKLSRDITIAAKTGLPDPAANARLRLAIANAKAESMPKDNIDRAIKKAAGGEADNMEEIRYEGFGPGGVGVIVEVLTDNRNRTNGEIKKIFERGNADVGKPGSSAYLFDRKGFFAIDAAKHPDEDALMTVALEAGAEDLTREGDVFEVTCDTSSFSTVLEALKAANVEPVEAEVKYLAKVQKDIDVETGKKLVKLIEALDDYDDVQNVSTDAALTEEMGE